MTNVPEEISLKKQRHVLLLQRGDEGYGVASTVTEFALALARHNQLLTVVCVTEGRLCARLREASFTVDVLGLQPPPRAVNGSLLKRGLLITESKTAQKRIANEVIRRHQGVSIDVVQTMNYLLLESCGRISKAFQAIGVWRMPSGVQTVKYKKIKQQMMSRICDKYGIVNMANSDFTGKSIARNSRLSTFVHHGCDPVRFNPDTVIPVTRDEFDIGKEDVVFGIFAHIHPDGEKGQHIAVNALLVFLQRWADKQTQIHLILFGDPIDSDYVSSLRMSVQDCKRLTLHLPGAVSDVERYYNMLDVSLSTRITPEPFGLSVIESMMMGVPVLAHALGGPAETVIDKRTGWLVRDTTQGQWVEAFQQVMAERAQWPEFSAQARAHALKSFTIDAELAGWAHQLDTLM